MIVTDPQAERQYVLLAERKLPADKRRRFWHRALTVREEHQALDHGQGQDADGNPRTNIGSLLFFVLGCGLTRWENVRDKQGNEVKLERDPRSGKPTDESLAHLTLGERMEIAKAIEAGSQVTEAELELSAPPSNPPSET